MIVDGLAHMKLYEIVGRLDPVDVRHAQVEDAVSGFHSNTFGAGSREAIEDFGQRTAAARPRSRFDELQDAIDRAVESCAVHGLQHVVECMDLERIDRVLVVGSHEHNWRHAIRTNRAYDAQSVEFGHLYIEKHEV